MATSKEAAEALVPKFKFERLLNQGIAEYFTFPCSSRLLARAPMRKLRAQ